MTSWDVARLTARLGDHNIRTNSETQHVERKIKRVVRHRGFDMRTLVILFPNFYLNYLINGWLEAVPGSWRRGTKCDCKHD